MQTFVASGSQPEQNPRARDRFLHHALRQRPAFGPAKQRCGAGQGVRVPGACSHCATVNDEDAKFCKSCGTKLLALLFALLAFAAPALAQIQMPDPKQMSGIPRPVTDLPEGHVSVRLTDGSVLEKRVELARGHPRRPCSGAELRGKLEECARQAVVPRSPEQVTALVRAIDELERGARAADLAALLA